MTTRNTKDELASYGDGLAALGFHPGTVRAYTRALREFLEAHPEALEADRDGCASVVESHMAGAPVAYDSMARDASLRRWYLMRFGVRLGRTRLDPADFATSPRVEAEVGRLRARLGSDGLTPEAVSAHCRVVGMFLGWLFPDGDVDPSRVDEAAALAFLGDEMRHLLPSSRKVEAGRLRRYLLMLAEEDPSRGEGLPFAPACWGTSSLPRMIGEDELEAILSAQTGDEVGSRNRAALLLMANMGLRCCEVAALAIDDVDFANGRLDVPAFKGRQARRLPLEAGTGAALADYVMRHRPPSDSRVVLLRNKSRRGEPLGAVALRSSLRYQARLAGVPDFATHMLRRRAATSMLAAGTPLKVVADVLGHSEVQTAKGYLRVDLGRLRSVSAEWPGAMS